MNKYKKAHIKRQYKKMVEEGIIPPYRNPHYLKSKELAFKRWEKQNPFQAMISRHFQERELKQLREPCPLFSLMDKQKNLDTKFLVWERSTIPDVP